MTLKNNDISFSISEESKEALKAFDKLDVNYQIIIKIVALFYNGVQDWTILSILEKLPQFTLPLLNVNKVRVYLQFCKETGLITYKRQAYHCKLQFSNILTRKLVTEDIFPDITKTIFHNGRNTYYWKEDISFRELRGFRSLRVSIFQKDKKTFEEIFKKVSSVDKDAFISGFHRFLDPFDQPWLESFPLELQELIVMWYVQHFLVDCSPSPYDDFVQKWFKVHGLDDELCSFYGLGLICKGEFTLAKEILQKSDGVLSSNMKLAIQFLKGGLEIEEEYEANLKIFKKQKRKRKTFFNDIGGAFYGLFLLKENKVDTTKLFEHSLKHDSLKIELWTYGLLLLLPSLQEGQKLSYENQRLLDRGLELEQPPLISFLALLAQFWFLRSTMKPDVLLSLHLQYQEKGLHWLAAETAVMLETLDIASSLSKPSSEFFLKHSMTPLAQFFQAKEEWRMKLDALLKEYEVTERPSRPKKSHRVIWLLSFYGKSGVELTAKEQTLNKNGLWSKGRTIAFKRLFSDWMDLDFFTAQDQKIAQSIEMNSSYYGGKDYRFNNKKLLSALIEHPLIFSDNEARHPIILLKKEPKLEIKEEDKSFILQISPEPTENFSYLVKEIRSYVYEVTIFEPTHLDIHLKLMGKLRVPLQAKAEIEQVMHRLSTVLPIQSDIQVELETVEEIESNAKLLVQLFPFGSGLKIELRIRPFGKTGLFVRPGEGQRTLISRIDGKLVQTERNVKREKEYRDQLLKECSSLLFLETENTGLVDELQSCLEMLQEMQAVDNENIQIEWPKGQAFHLKTAGIADFEVKVQKKQEWFEASGELTIDANLKLNINQILELLSSTEKQFISLGEGDFLALTKQLRRKLEELGGLTEMASEQDRKFHNLSALALQGVLESFPKAEFDAYWEQLQSNWEKLATKKYTLPSTFRGELRNYQQEGFLWLSRLADLGLGACLADDMGLGKTVQVLAFLLTQAAKGPCLIVAPSSVCLNWASEVLRFTPTLRIHQLKSTQRTELIDSLKPFDILICSYGLMQSEHKNLGGKEWQCIVLDEAHSIKNSAAKRSQAAMKLSGKIRIAMTGTPVQNHLGEIWSLFSFLNPGMLGSEEDFNRKFNSDDTKGKTHLNKQLRPFVLRRSKNEVLQELPSKTEITIQVESSKEEIALYESLRLNALAQLSGGEDGKPAIIQVLKQLMILRLSCCHPSLVLPETEIQSSKIKTFLSLVEELIENGHKILVFSQFVKYLKIIRANLDRKKVSYQYFDGSTPQKHRQTRINAFQAGEGDLFLISLKSGGVGINLTAADYVIHMDPWWNPAVEDQASDRAHRIGQKRPVTVYRLITKNTIEEKILNLHQHKRDIIEDVLDGTNKSGKLSMKELMDLLNDSKHLE